VGSVFAGCLAKLPLLVRSDMKLDAKTIIIVTLVCLPNAIGRLSD
jgi:hypothetical protein